MLKSNIAMEMKGQRILGEIASPRTGVAIRRAKIVNKIVYENDTIAVVQVMGQRGKIQEREKVCLNQLEDSIDRITNNINLLGYRIKDEIAFLERIKSALERMGRKLKVTGDIGDVDLNSLIIIPSGDADAIKEGQKVLYFNCTGDEFVPKYYVMFYNIIDGKFDKPRRYHIDVNRRYGDNFSKETRTVDHMDGNSSNNAVNNLRWATNSENRENRCHKGYCWNSSGGCFRSSVKGFPSKSFSTKEAAAEYVYQCEQQKKTEFTFDIAQWRKDLTWVILLEMLGEITREEADILAIWIHLEKRKGTPDEICLERFNLTERFGFQRR